MSDEERLAEIRDTYVDGLVISSGSAVAVVQELLAHIDALTAALAEAGGAGEECGSDD